MCDEGKDGEMLKTNLGKEDGVRRMEGKDGGEGGKDDS